LDEAYELVVGDVLAEPIGVGGGLGIGAGPKDADRHAPELRRDAHLPVAIVIEAVVLEFLLAEMTEDRHLSHHVVHLVDQVVRRVQLPVVRAPRVRESECLVVDAVAVLGGDPLPREAGIDLGGVGLHEAARIAAGVPVVQRAQVDAEVIGKGELEAAVPVGFETGGDVGIAVRDPADVRVPVSDVEAALVRDVEPALQRGLLVGLRNAAEYVLGIEADVGGESPVGLGCRGSRRWGGSRRWRLGEGSTRIKRGERDDEYGLAEHRALHGRIPV